MLLGFEPAGLQRRREGRSRWTLTAVIAASVLTSVLAWVEWTFTQQPSCAHDAALTPTQH
jgi:hypothetical protein